MTTQREAAIAPRFDRGTKETRDEQKKRGPGTMQALMDRGTIGGYEVRAADEIERVYGYQVRALLSSTMRYGPREDKGYSDNDPFWFVDAFVMRYKPWADQKHPFVETCIDVLIEGYSGRDLDRWKGRRRGVSVALLIEGLRDYAIRAQWVDAGTLDDWRREMERAA